MRRVELSKRAKVLGGIGAIFGIYLTLAIASTWPLTCHLGRSLPVGTQTAATVPLFGVWTVWWNCDRITALYRGYWNAPIFHPSQGTFAISEPMALTAAAAPLSFGRDRPITAHNVMLLLALACNGCSAFLLLRRWEVDILPAALGGSMVEMLPFVHNELGAFQLVPVFGIVWTLSRLHDFAAEPTSRRAALLAVSYAMTYYLCTYYALFLAVLLPIGGGWLLGSKLAHKRTWILLSLSAALAVILMFPVLRAQLRARHQYDMNRSEKVVQQLSARLADYRVAPWQSPLFGNAVPGEARSHIRLSVGVVKYCLALVGAILGLFHCRSRKWTVFCLTILVAALLLSLGPNVRFGNWSPYSLLIAWIPGFAQARSVFRFAVFVQLALVLLGVNSLQALWELGVATKQSARAKLILASCLILGLAATVELWPPTQKLFRLPSVEQNLAWLDWLRQETATDSVIACIPFPTGKREADYEETALWMYWGTIHRRRMVNGYSGFFPKPFLRLKADMTGFPESKSLAHLKRVGVQYCVVRRTSASPRMIESRAQPSDILQLAFSDERAQIDIYRLVPDR